ncbi:hypothetical protein GGTG_09305 [Gaeumannomyces tritici R3-111a-1]|uniref:Interferon-induced GTP-binding protein Mx n=1 Tax=Gaeumannomyces tritici (strain R3-111a-1) TaxID=644352 RepID=J3P708_GAET3|nr:hypothetical protein GGTG_09305 [Gaeumannomyces tritici R3-111a-1]EJT72439.1 hypothetical protein GGTG_09305 [Gaeumannomyces tritici R3-111a-1]
MTAGGTSVPDLRSKEHRALFDIIDRLRSHGIGEVIDLPEIIVCGDQSAGKSSVLEAISGHPFPTKDGVCTRFVTELVLRREPSHKFKVSISPGPGRAAKDAERLRGFSDTIRSEQRLDEVVDAAKEAMGLSDSKRFSNDVLRVEICGPDQAHLTMVDLPGIFRAGSSEQSVEDVKTVSAMVQKAMKRPRSIILAVVSANNEFNNQEITELARKLDPTRSRTLGLITKPDKLDEGSRSEEFYIKLARNQEVHLELGWHVLRNRGSNDTSDTSAKTRDYIEKVFFSKGAWLSVDSSLLGVAALRRRLSEVLGGSILTNLPALRGDVLSNIHKCEDTLVRLGDPRSSPGEQRRYLLAVSRRFSSLMTAAIEGNYSDSFFGDAKTDDGYAKRIRALVQNSLRDFGEKMHQQGKLQSLRDDDEAIPGTSPGTPKHVRRSDYLRGVTVLMDRSKGRELPGTFNPLIVADLFRKECQPWEDLAAEATSSIVDAVTWMALTVLHQVALAKTVGGISSIVEQGIEERQQQLNTKVKELLAPHYEGHPITYNNFLTDMVKKAQKERRDKRRAEALKEVIESAISGAKNRRALHSAIEQGDSPPSSPLGYVDIGEVIQLLSQLEGKETDLEEEASGLATDYAEAYYKVALKRFIDEIANLAVERQLIRHLPNLFTPEMILELTDDQVSTLAAEDDQAIAERDRCQKLLTALQKSLDDLRRLQSARIDIKRPQLSRPVIPAATGSAGASDARRPSTPPAPSNSSQPSNREETPKSTSPERRWRNPESPNPATAGTEVSPPADGEHAQPARKTHPRAIGFSWGDWGVAPKKEEPETSSPVEYERDDEPALEAVKTLSFNWSAKPGVEAPASIEDNWCLGSSKKGKKKKKALEAFAAEFVDN